MSPCNFCPCFISFVVCHHFLIFLCLTPPHNFHLPHPLPTPQPTPTLPSISLSEFTSSGHCEPGVYVWDSGKSFCGDGEATWWHARDDPLQWERQTAWETHKVPHYTGVYMHSKRGISHAQKLNSKTSSKASLFLWLNVCDALKTCNDVWVLQCHTACFLLSTYLTWFSSS